MARQITCGCGYVARGESVDEVVDLIQAHLRSDHPELAAHTRREDIAGWVEIVD